MKTGLMVLLAVTFGVLLIGVMPYQFSNLQTFREIPNLASRDPTQSGSYLNDTIQKTQTDSNETIGVTAPENLNSFEMVKSDLPYYSLWAFNILVASLVYLFAKRRV